MRKRPLDEILKDLIKLKEKYRKQTPLFESDPDYQTERKKLAREAAGLPNEDAKQ